MTRLVGVHNRRISDARLHGIGPDSRIIPSVSAMTMPVRNRLAVQRIRRHPKTRVIS
ncbi:MAG: hypothetical protein H6Q86_3590 [candidate division NC10 bacterium]|jgi:hypothetical protein|nr:hypothetical protein [candidate division NC10 bacterium]MBP2672166.1 hypothetical protein [candidate division NC10 bacterium]